jgi:hypothetical protein
MRTAQPAGPVPRPLSWLLIGHLTVAAGVVVLVVLLALSEPTRPAEQLAPRRGLDVLTSGYLLSGLGALGVAQILSIRRLLAHRRAVVGDPGRGFDATGLGARMERLEWSMGLALYPIVIGVSGLLVSSPPAPLLALYCLGGYVVDVPELDAATRAMRRIAPSGVLGAVLLAAAALTGSAGPLLAMAIALPLTFTLGFLSLNLSQALRVRLGVPLRDSVRRTGARTR